VFAHSPIPDVASIQPNAGDGDGYPDGYPDAVDCDNEDPAVTPFLPEYDGYSSPYCKPIAESCYICPPGSVSPPGDDDGSDDGSDDDDGAQGDEPTAEPGNGSFVIVEGCRPGGGCGLAWTCDLADVEPSGGGAATIWLAAWLPVTRRRRTS
jgi:hypothetical protein